MPILDPLLSNTEDRAIHAQAAPGLAIEELIDLEGRWSYHQMAQSDQSWDRGSSRVAGWDGSCQALCGPKEGRQHLGGRG